MMPTKVIAKLVKQKTQNSSCVFFLFVVSATKKIAEIVITWEPDAARNILELAQKPRPDGKPFLVGVVGIPGSGTSHNRYTQLSPGSELTYCRLSIGKSTSCEIMAEFLPNALVMPMDGYHYSKEQLNAMENPEDVVYRRGAPDTFDPASLEKDLERIMEGDEERVSIPGFDHAVGDPQADQHTFVRSEHDIVICEGIYLLHDDDGWAEIKKNLDYSIYIQADIDTCIDRLKERNKCIPGYTEEEIAVRCDLVDRKNAEMAQTSKAFATQVVKSGAVGAEELCDVEED